MISIITLKLDSSTGEFAPSVPPVPNCSPAGKGKEKEGRREEITKHQQGKNIEMVPPAHLLQLPTRGGGGGSGGGGGGGGGRGGGGGGDGERWRWRRRWEAKKWRWGEDYNGAKSLYRPAVEMTKV
eukprot:767016-Hanusia_phi.AAC.7